MSLSSYVPPKRKIEFDGGDLQVRAISLQDVAMILDSHQYVVDRIASIIRESGVIDERMLIDTIMEIVRESPILAANIICICSDEMDAMEAAIKLPAPVQLQIFQAISEITFKDEAGLKKFVADVMSLIRGMLPPTMSAAA
jgi:hypothetical protein